MTAPARLHPTPTAPDDLGRIFDAAADMIATAASYTEISAQAAQVRDLKVLSYSIRCATTALITAAELAAEMRPALQQGRRVA